jgi:myo-inositol 2-dehydrogenase / D-chiro-inositol 1-dehydrogenase
VGVGAARDRVVTSDMHGVRHEAVADFFERFESAFQREMQAFVDACRTGAFSTVTTGLTLADATEATRVGAAITRALHSGQVESV